MAAHYGAAVIPARVRKPRDKAKVEAGVLVVERWILVVRQYSSAAKSKQNTIAKGYRSGSACVFVLTIGPCGFGFQHGNLLAHLRNLPLQSFLGHKERTQQVPTQMEKVGNRLE
jgi:hypothetical protein